MEIMDANGYNFRSQEVFVSDGKPTYMCTISQDQLVVVYESAAVIRIYDLSVISERMSPIITIPLIDTNVRRVIHSHYGNYLAIMADNHRKEIHAKSVRVYCNYWIDGQAVRIRPNGQLMASRAASDGTAREIMCAEVIDLMDAAIGSDSQWISCCERSGNLSICCGFKVLLYSYERLRMSDTITRSDFVLLLDIRLQWFATRVSLVDHYIGVASKTHFSLLSLKFDFDGKPTDSSGGDDNGVASDSVSDSDAIVWDFDDQSKSARLPGLFDRKSDGHQALNHCHQVIGPVDQCLSCKFTLTMNHLNVESRVCRAGIQVLVCQYFAAEEPLVDSQIVSYCRENVLFGDPLNVLMKDNEYREEMVSNPSRDIIGSALLLVTKTHLYSYSLFNRIELKDKISLSDKLKSYSVNTADDTLHVLTDKGLQTYAMNLLSVFYDYKTFVPIFKLNFRTFMNIDMIFSTKSYVLLISEMQNNLRTIYSLKKPSISEIYSDMTSGLSDRQLKIDDKINLLSFLNSILHFNCDFQADTNCEIRSIYRENCVHLCNFLTQYKSDDSQTLITHLIRLSEIKFSHLINYKSNYSLIYEFIDKNLDSDECFDVSECEVLSLKNFLHALRTSDYTMFCRLCLRQTFEFDVRLVIIELLQTIDSSDSQLPRLSTTKLLLDNKDVIKATDYMLLIQDSSDSYNELCSNYRIIFLNTSLVVLFEKSCRNIFYKYLLHLADYENSVEFVYNLLDSDYEQRVWHNFLIMAYNTHRHLFTDKLVFNLIKAYIGLLCHTSGKHSSYAPIECIYHESVDWLQLLPPIHSLNNECFCVKCHEITRDLYLVLYEAITDHQIIKSQINSMFAAIDDNSGYEWLSTARLLSLPVIDCVERLLDDFPHLLSPYLRDVCSSDTVVLKRVIRLLDQKIGDIKDLDVDGDVGQALCFTLSQLATSLAPEELVEILPHNWQDFCKCYVQKCITHMQSNILRQKIINLGLELKAMNSSV